MNDFTPAFPPPRVPAVEPELLASAIFLFSEYLQRVVEEKSVSEDEEAEDEDDDDGSTAINMREVLDLFAEELGTGVPVTLNLYMRVTALYRLLAASPSLAQFAAEPGDGASTLNETALLAAAKLDLHISRSAAGGVAEFDPREFREALADD
jgi:hypothetical protein